MGLLISRFKSPQTTIEVLEQIDKDISRLQRNRKANQDQQKKLVATFLIYSVIVYILAAVIFFFLYFPEPWTLRFLYSLPLLLFPFIIWGLKKLLYWYFVKRITSNDQALQSLREKKKTILEEVMETETYKKAREILEKFDPSRLRQLEGAADSPPGRSVANTGSSGTEMHQRVVQAPSLQAPGHFNPRMAPTTPQRPRQSMGSPTALRTPAPGRSQNNAMIRVAGTPAPGYIPPGPPMPRTILSRDRGVMDRMMDYLVGDGPENRYALICQYCHSHNGMALREEFEYLSFRCCYCFNLNAARKQRPIAPRLEFFAPLGASQRPGQQPGSEESDAGKAKDESDSSDGEDEDDSPKSDKSADSEIQALQDLETVQALQDLETENAAQIPPHEGTEAEPIETADQLEEKSEAAQGNQEDPLPSAAS